LSIVVIYGYRVDEATEEDGEEAEVRRRSSSVLEAKERAHNFLRDELQKAQQVPALFCRAEQT